MLPSIGDKLIFLTQLIAAMALVLAAYAGGAFLVTRLLSRLKGPPNAECEKDSVRSIDWKEWYVSFTLGGFILWGWAVLAFALVRPLRVEKIAATWEGAAAYGRETIAGLLRLASLRCSRLSFSCSPDQRESGPSCVQRGVSWWFWGGYWLFTFQPFPCLAEDGTS